MKDKYKHELKVYVANGSAIIGAVLLKRLMDKLLRTAFDKEPPKKPDEQDNASWSEALGWAALSGAMTGALKLVIKRGGLNNML